MRISDEMLQQQVDKVNVAAGVAAEGLDIYKVPGFHRLDYANGFVGLVRNAEGGEEIVIDRCSRPRLAEAVRAYLLGIEAGKAAQTSADCSA